MGSFIWNLGFWFAVAPSTRIQLLDHFHWRLILQLIKDISSVLEKVIRYFNGTIISISSKQAFSVRPVICCLNLNEALLFLLAENQ